MKVVYRSSLDRILEKRGLDEICGIADRCVEWALERLGCVVAKSRRDPAQGFGTSSQVEESA